LPESSRAFGRSFAEQHRVHEGGALVGLNTGAGGRWVSKQLSVERTIELAEALHTALEGRATFLVMGGGPEAERNRAILDGSRARHCACARSTRDATTRCSISRRWSPSAICS